MTTVCHLLLFHLLSTYLPAIQPYQYPRELLGEINYLRRAVADENKIPNMYGLKWSKELENIAEKEAENFHLLLQTKRYFWRDDIIADNDRWNVNDLSEKFDKNKDDPEKHLKDGSYGILEVMAPNQREIGCASYGLSRGDKWQFLCLLGPERNFKLWDFNPEARAKTQFNCSAEYYKRKNFCEFLGSPEKFIEDLNNVRKKYANKFNIPDMHAVSWTPEYAKIAESIRSLWRPSAESRKHWQHTDMYTYDELETNIDAHMELLLKRNKTDREVYVTGERVYNPGAFRNVANWTNWSNTISNLLEPLQKFVGCGYVPYGSGSDHVMCVIGPRGSYTLWNTEKESTAIPGSKCSTGYENKDGLCTPIAGENVSLYGDYKNFLTDINNVRRELAENHTVSSMYEVSWSKELEDIAKTLDWNSHWPNAPELYRYTRIGSYQGVREDLFYAIHRIKNLQQRSSPYAQSVRLR